MPPTNADNSRKIGNVASTVAARPAGVDLFGANLHAAQAVRTDLSGANLAGADLTAANLADANLANADLSGADAIAYERSAW